MFFISFKCIAFNTIIRQHEKGIDAQKRIIEEFYTTVEEVDAV